MNTYRILHNIDTEKTTILNNDNEFVEFTQKVREENGDKDIITINTVSDSIYYINNYCENLILSIN
jgi:hypothetical protein